jgi:hypothetical protein
VFHCIICFRKINHLVPITICIHPLMYGKLCRAHIIFRSLILFSLISAMILYLTWNPMPHILNKNTPYEKYKNLFPIYLYDFLHLFCISYCAILSGTNLRTDKVWRGLGRSQIWTRDCCIADRQKATSPPQFTKFTFLNTIYLLLQHNFVPFGISGSDMKCTLHVASQFYAPVGIFSKKLLCSGQHNYTTEI